MENCRSQGEREKYVFKTELTLNMYTRLQVVLYTMVTYIIICSLTSSNYKRAAARIFAVPKAAASI